MKLLKPALCALYMSTMAITQPIWAADRESDIQKYVTTFTGAASIVQVKACQILQWEGLSDTRIFDPIEADLLKGYKSQNSDRHEIDRYSWFARCLAASGNAKYKPTLEAVYKEAFNPKIKKNAQRALEELPKYTKWNAIISAGEGNQSGDSGKYARYINMIKSQDPELKRLGAKRIHFENVYTAEVLDTLNAEIIKGYRGVTDDKMSYDSYAWMMKALAGSRNMKYKDTIVEVSEKTTNARLKQYAERSLRYYGAK